MNDSTITAMADQTMAAIAQAEQHAPHNDQLHEHPRIAEIIQRAMAWTPDYPNPLPARLIVADRLGTMFALSTLDMDEQPLCCVCYRVEDDPQPNPRPTYRTRRLHVNAGATNIELAFCSFHEQALEMDYGSPRYVPGLVWLP